MNKLYFGDNPEIMHEMESRYINIQHANAEK